MSKQRQRERAAREAQAASTARQRNAEADRARRVGAARRARAERNRLRWSRVRLWQTGPMSGARRERWGVLGIIVLLVLVVVFIWTRSLAAVAGTALICVIASPVLAAFVLHDRNRS